MSTKFAIPTTKFRDELLYVPCAMCGAARGSRCRGKYGQKIERIHATRAQQLKKKAGPA